MLAKSLTFLAGADAAGIVLGARVPIILRSRADSVMTRLASLRRARPENRDSNADVAGASGERTINRPFSGLIRLALDLHVFA